MPPVSKTIWENGFIWITDITTDFHKGFVESLIAALTNCQTNEYILPRRYVWTRSKVVSWDILPIKRLTSIIDPSPQKRTFFFERQTNFQPVQVHNDYYLFFRNTFLMRTTCNGLSHTPFHLGGLTISVNIYIYIYIVSTVLYQALLQGLVACPTIPCLIVSLLQKDPLSFMLTVPFRSGTILSDCTQQNSFFF